MKSRTRNGRANTQRQHLANEIARLMWEGQIEDFKLAKEKAMKRFGLRQAELPDNQSISNALNAYSQIFNLDSHNGQRSRYLGLAKELMRILEVFDPRAVGLEPDVAILSGTTLRIHVFSEPAEAVDLYLQEQGVEFSLEDKRFRFGVDEYENRPSYLFEYQGVKVSVSVFPQVARNRVPLSPIDGRPMRRMSLQKVDELLNNR